jgi:hypothetical protein
MKTTTQSINKSLSASQKKVLKSRGFDSVIASFKIEGVSFSKDKISSLRSQFHPAK